MPGSLTGLPILLFQPALALLASMLSVLVSKVLVIRTTYEEDSADHMQIFGSLVKVFNAREAMYEVNIGVASHCCMVGVYRWAFD